MSGDPGVATLPISQDDAAAPLDLGANTFRFYGQVYGHSTMYVSSNALITFGSPVDDYHNSPDLSLPVGTPPSPPTIAPLWADWNADPTESNPDAQVLTRFDDLNGDGTPDQLIIQWNSVAHFSPRFFFSPSPATFQAVLSLNTPHNGNILFSYIDLDTGETNTSEGRDATVGIRDADPTADALNVAYGGNNPDVATGKAILIRQANQPPVANADGYTTNEATPLVVGTPGVLGNDSDPDGNPITAMTVATPTHGQLALDSSGAFTYTPDLGFSGTDSFQYVASDGQELSAPATVSIIVVPVGTAPTVTAADASGVEGSPVSLSLSAALVDTDGSESLGVQITDVPAGASLSAGTNQGGGVWSVTPIQLPGLTLSSPDDVSADLKLIATATESANGSAASTYSTFHVTVANLAPTISNVITTVDPVAVKTAVSASAQFTDSGVLDTHKAVWDWGDGTTSTGTVAEPGPGQSGTVGGSHAYAAAGTYTVHLTVGDDDGGEGTGTSKSFVVVYDPTAGFVTGGGWIDSPAGANVNNPTAVGRGRFGFVSKYQNGTNIPTGQTQFTLNVANLNFHSTAYDWMVVTGGRADYHGAGTMNGLAGYHFQLTAIDGGSTADGIDRVRLRIWCDATGSLVYDNGLGALDDNGPGTALAGGSIVVHG